MKNIITSFIIVSTMIFTVFAQPDLDSAKQYYYCNLLNFKSGDYRTVDGYRLDSLFCDEVSFFVVNKSSSHLSNNIVLINEITLKPLHSNNLNEINNTLQECDSVNLNFDKALIYLVIRGELLSSINYDMADSLCFYNKSKLLKYIYQNSGRTSSPYKKKEKKDTIRIVVWSIIYKKKVEYSFSFKNTKIKKVKCNYL